MAAEYDEPEVIDFTFAAVTIGAYAALADGQAIGEVFDLQVCPTGAGRLLTSAARPGATASISVGARRFTGRVVIADPQDLVVQVEAEEC